MTDVTYQVEIKFDKYLEALLNCADVAPYSKRAACDVLKALNLSECEVSENLSEDGLILREENNISTQQLKDLMDKLGTIERIPDDNVIPIGQRGSKLH